MTAEPRRMRTLRALAFACAALVLAITTLSAFIRLSRTGLGCEPWPQCYAVEALRIASMDNAAIGAARALLTHTGCAQPPSSAFS